MAVSDHCDADHLIRRQGHARTPDSRHFSWAPGHLTPDSVPHMTPRKLSLHCASLTFRLPRTISLRPCVATGSLVKGTGEILEEIVSKDRQLQINKVCQRRPNGR